MMFSQVLSCSVSFMQSESRVFGPKTEHKSFFWVADLVYAAADSARKKHRDHRLANEVFCASSRLPANAEGMIDKHCVFLCKHVPKVLVKYFKINNFERFCQGTKLTNCILFFLCQTNELYPFCAPSN